MRNEEDSPSRPKIWIWILFLVLFGVLMVPIIILGLTIEKTGWRPLLHQVIPTMTAPETVQTPQKGIDLSGLRAKIEKVAAEVIQTPLISSNVNEVKIQTSPETLNVATNEIHKLLADQKHQFVEAVDKDQIRIIVVLESKDWPALAASLEAAATKDGFVYHGPSATKTANQADTVVAEIEILRKPGN